MFRSEVVPVPPMSLGVVAEVVIVGVTMVGEVPKTAAPVPVSSESAPLSPVELVRVDCLAFSWVWIAEVTLST